MPVFSNAPTNWRFEFPRLSSHDGRKERESVGLGGGGGWEGFTADSLQEEKKGV